MSEDSSNHMQQVLQKKISKLNIFKFLDMTDMLIDLIIIVHLESNSLFDNFLINRLSVYFRNNQEQPNWQNPILSLGLLFLKTGTTSLILSSSRKYFFEINLFDQLAKGIIIFLLSKILITFKESSRVLTLATFNFVDKFLNFLDDPNSSLNRNYMIHPNKQVPTHKKFLNPWENFFYFSKKNLRLSKNIKFLKLFLIIIKIKQYSKTKKLPILYVFYTVRNSS